MNKQPEQTARTKQTIIDAFWKLAKKQGIDKVTVSAVMKTAKLNRGTFYVYFTDIEDLLSQSEEDMIHTFQKNIKAVFTKDDTNHPETAINYEAAINQLVEVFTLYDEKFFFLLGKQGDKYFLEKIRKEAAAMFREIFDCAGKDTYYEYYIAYASSAFIGLLSYWHDSGRKIDKEELASILYNLATKGIYRVVLEENQ